MYYVNLQYDSNAIFRFTKGIPDSYIMEMGGWKSDYVMKSVYRHALDDQKAEAMKKAALSIVEKTK